MSGSSLSTSRHGVVRRVWEGAHGKGAGLAQAIARLDDGLLMRLVFYTLLVGLAWTLATDYRELQRMVTADRSLPEFEQPVLPPYIPPGDGGGGAARPAPEVETPTAKLRERLSVSLGKGGVLQVTGMIDPGAAERFLSEIEPVSEYVKVIELESPGGSVADALAISADIRERGLKVRVRNGAFCASSCPIVLAGGVERTAGEKAAIGLHQIFTPGNTGLSADQEVSGTQATTAKITRHLESMGVDPAIWLHALETPPRQLYYLTAEELTRYRLATEIANIEG